MIKIYYLQVDKVNNTEIVRGIDYIHHAILNATEKPDVRKLIQDTTPEEDSALSALAIEHREPTQEEVDAYNRFMEENLASTPPLSTHLARVDSINTNAVKPATVTRTWLGKEYTYDCYVTESIKDQWQAGDVVVGDFVLVHFLENEVDKAIVIAKVFKTW